MYMQIRFRRVNGNGLQKDNIIILNLVSVLNRKWYDFPSQLVTDNFFLLLLSSTVFILARDQYKKKNNFLYTFVQVGGGVGSLSKSYFYFRLLHSLFIYFPVIKSDSNVNSNYKIGLLWKTYTIIITLFKNIKPTYFFFFAKMIKNK